MLINFIMLHMCLVLIIIKSLCSYMYVCSYELLYYVRQGYTSINFSEFKAFWSVRILSIIVILCKHVTSVGLMNQVP